MCSCVPSIFLSHFAFSPLLSHGRTPDATLDCVCMRLCICLLYFILFYFFALKFNVSESLVKDERKVCGHACAYNKLKHLICPKEPRVSEDVFYPFSLTLFSIALQMRLSLLIYLQAKGELTFLWYTVVLKFLPLNTFAQAVTEQGQWHAGKASSQTRLQYRLVEKHKQRGGGLVQYCLIFNRVSFNSTTFRFWDMCA